jgi:hypothetical protein
MTLNPIEIATFRKEEEKPRAEERHCVLLPM